MTLEFLSPVPGERAAPGSPPAVSPLEPWLLEAGARFTERHGWRLPIDFGAPVEEERACREGVGIADRSAIGKLELQGSPASLASLLLAQLADGGVPEPGRSARIDDGTLWLSSPDRALVICEPADTPALRERLADACEGSPHRGLVELTAAYGAIELRGPRARELLERLTAIDVRPAALPPGGVRLGAVAELPATLLRASERAFLILVAATEAPDAWEIVLDAGAPLGLRPVGETARGEPAPVPAEEAIGA